MNKKDDILKAALKLFVEQGEQSTSMKWIAKEAKCGIGTMYNYFQSKEELINELYIDIKTRLFTHITKALNTSLPVKQQFIDTWLLFIEYTNANHLEYKFMESFGHSPKICEDSNNKIMQLILPVLEIYERGKKEGIIKNYETMQLLFFTSGAITTSIINCPETNKQDVILMAWDAIKS